jgi:O-succinylbenzoic acid--CoA ligase
MFNIDFDNPIPQLICHPDYQKFEKEILTKLNPFFLRDHFILFSSGTTGGDLKGYAVSKKALFSNAEAVNKHFGLTSEDVWGLSLPVYHIGGLSVLARAHLLKNKVIDARKWEPETWAEKMQDVTITTIVPTQLFDLIQKKISPPKKLRYIVVGGDLLSDGLKEKAVAAGWSVIRTFGMSEVCSQLASTKTPESDSLELLPIHQIKIDEGRLLVKSSSLFTLEFNMGERFKIKTAKELSDKEGFYITKDQADFTNRHFRHLGRLGDEVKISGHLVNLLTLRNQLSTYLVTHNLFNQMEFSLEEDERKGKKLVLLSLKKVSEEALSEISKLISPVKIDEVKEVPSFERTALGKLKKI